MSAMNRAVEPPETPDNSSKATQALLRHLKWVRRLQAIPGVGRLRFLRPGSDAQVGVLVDALTGFAMLDGELNSVEADLILDLLRSAFPEVDHGWLNRRLQRAVRNPRPLQGLAMELKDSFDDAGKMSLALQLFTLVDAAGRTARSRASFEVFMRRLGRPEYGTAILREMLGHESDGGSENLPFERVVFGHESADVVLPPAAINHEFRVYRSADLILVRNTGRAPLMIRGHSVASGTFLRMRERQPLVVPGWSLTQEDLIFFLNVKRTKNTPAIYLEQGDRGLTAARVRGRASVLRIRFGLNAEVEALVDSSLHAGSRGPLKKAELVHCNHHERVGDSKGFSVSINDLRKSALQAGRRFRLLGDRQEYLVSNDASALSLGDLLLGPKLSPRVVLFIRYDEERAEGELEVRESQGPVLVDGIPVKTVAPLRDGSLIRLSGSQAVRCRFSEGFLDEERSLIESLRVLDVLHDFNPEARALDHLSFEINRGEMLCIIGPSGSGKSTLLSVLSGQMEPTRGQVMLNGASLYENRAKLVPFIAYMPQEEALSPQLSVREHLRHAVTIRRPALTLAEHERRVDSMLAELGLQGIGRRLVGSRGDKSISGGERSRLNLGLDLGSRAEVFLFDEPISGLSSKDSEHVAETLRSLAREKIVIASLHRPGAMVLRLFDRVLLLDSGGKLAYYGTPANMVGYFRDACEELSIQHPSVRSNAALGADFVFDVLETPLSAIGSGSNTGAARRFPPSFWQERYESHYLMASLQHPGPRIPQISEDAGFQVTPEPPKPSRPVRAMIAVFATHFMRSFLSKARNRGTIYSTMLEAPLLAALIAITLRSSPEGPYQFYTALHIPAYLFLSATVAMFLGLTNSATEILRDRPMLRRERNCQLGSASYLLAKFSALAIIASVQCLIYLIVGNYYLEIDGTLLHLWWWMSLTAWTGTAMALVISTVVKTERAALTAVPLLLVPQMLLAGALVPYREMNRGLFSNAKEVREKGGSPVPSLIMPLRYAYEAMIVSQATANPFERERLGLQKKIDRMRTSEEEMTGERAERFDLYKEGLRALLASGASSPEDALDRINRISKAAISGVRFDLETMKLWPDREKKARPASEFFVNERIDLMVREAETFRNDYRNEERRVIFLALKKPIPFYPKSEKQNDLKTFTERKDEIATPRYCAIILCTLISACLIISIRILGRQNRKTC